MAGAGLGLRLRGGDWDAGRHLHPDERFLAMVHSAIDLPDSPLEYLDTARSPLNPNNRGYAFYVYGDLPLTVVQLLGTWFAAPGNQLDERLFGLELGTHYGAVHRLGRGISAVCDLLALLLLYAVGTRLYGRAVGLLAAALYGGAVLPIQQAHFFTVDAMANLFVVAGLWLAARAATRARWSDDVLFGLALGAGLACKLSVFPVAALLGIGVVLRFAAQWQAAPAAAAGAAPGHRAAPIAVRGLLSLNVVVLTGLLTFRLLQPYAFAPAGPTPVGLPAPNPLIAAADLVAPPINPRWAEQMDKSRRQQTGDDDAPPNHQWASRTPFAFPWRNLVQYGLGWPLGLVGWLGWAWALVEGLRGRPESWRHVLPVAWVALYFGWFGAGWVLTARYFLPLVPALCLTAAWALVRIAAPRADASSRDAAPPPAWRRAAGALAIAAVLITTYAWALAFTSIYTRPHTRNAASRWLYEHLPPRAALRIARDDGETLRQPFGLPSAPAAEIKDAPEPAATAIAPTAPVSARVKSAQSGTLRAIELTGVRAADGTTPRLTATVVAADRRVDAACSVEPSGAAECRVDPPLPLSADAEIEVRLAGDRPLRIAGTPLATEGHWDDALPVPLPDIGPEAVGFATYGLEMAWEDDVVKRRRMQHVLDNADYLVMSSNRFVESLPRNPRRWPMTVDYYRALFSGELGFALAAEFTSPPRLGAWTIDDRGAEEALTVYDHPHVLIFRKSTGYDPVRTAAILGHADLDRVVRKPAVAVFDPPVTIDTAQVGRTSTADAPAP